MSLKKIFTGNAPNPIGVSFSPMHHPSSVHINRFSITFYSSSFRHSCSLSSSSSTTNKRIMSSRIFQFNSSSSSPPPPGESESKSILDAFFLGKALAEAISERIESTVGEILSTVGRVQAEQQNQLQQFQEDVLERAKRAKAKAAREAIEEQGLILGSGLTVSSSADDAVTVTVVSSGDVDQENAERDPPRKVSRDS
ncbi:hypothetical protein Droror1_Dr00020486 [Drosera rotundifolia]